MHAPHPSLPASRATSSRVVPLLSPRVASSKAVPFPPYVLLRRRSMDGGGEEVVFMAPGGRILAAATAVRGPLMAVSAVDPTPPPSTTSCSSTSGEGGTDLGEGRSTDDGATTLWHADLVDPALVWRGTSVGLSLVSRIRGSIPHSLPLRSEPSKRGCPDRWVMAAGWRHKEHRQVQATAARGPDLGHCGPDPGPYKPFFCFLKFIYCGGQKTPAPIFTDLP